MADERLVGGDQTQPFGGADCDKQPIERVPHCERRFDGLDHMCGANGQNPYVEMVSSAAGQSASGQGKAAFQGDA